MSVIVHIGQVTPRPIDGGRVAQSVVEYIGPKMGAVTYRPPSGWSYSFSALASGRVQYVQAQDIDFFRLRPDFRVLDEGRIDPEAERLKRMEGDIFDRLAARIGERSDEDKTTDPSGSPRKRAGRPSGRGFGAMLYCWMTCKRLVDFCGSVADAYDAVDHYFQNHTTPGREPPPRERYPSVRSDAKLKRENAGICLWHRHSEGLPTGLIPD